MTVFLLAQTIVENLSSAFNFYSLKFSQKYMEGQDLGS